MESSISRLPNAAFTSQVWLLTSGNVTTATKELNFSFDLAVIYLNLRSYRWHMAGAVQFQRMGHWEALSQQRGALCWLNVLCVQKTGGGASIRSKETRPRTKAGKLIISSRKIINYIARLAVYNSVKWALVSKTDASTLEEEDDSLGSERR